MDEEPIIVGPNGIEKSDSGFPSIAIPPDGLTGGFMPVLPGLPQTPAPSMPGVSSRVYIVKSSLAEVLKKFAKQSDSGPAWLSVDPSADTPTIVDAGKTM